MTKTELIARQALKIEMLELEVAVYRKQLDGRCYDQKAVVEITDPRARHPHKWEEIRKLQMRMAEINAGKTAEALAETQKIQARINEIWQEMIDDKSVCA